MSAVADRPEEADADTPLSAAQEGIWFLTEFSGARSAYNMPAAYVVRGEIDAARLEAALNRVIRRHGALSSVAVAQQHSVRTRRLAEPRLCLEVVELDAPIEDHRVMREAEAFVARPFDLRSALPIRAMLIRTSGGAALFVLTIHHMVADGWSINIIARDISESYSLGHSSFQDARAPQYADFVARERQLEREDHWAPDRAYWLNRLTGMAHTLDLCPRQSRPVVRTFSGQTFCKEISPPLVVRLRKYCRQQRATPATVLLAVYQALLHRYTGQTDFGIGMPSATRSAPGSDEAVGLFVNTVVIRATVNSDAPFAQLARDVRKSVFTALEHNEYPFLQVVRDAKVAPDPTREPLAQVSFNYVVLGKCPLQLHGSTCSRKHFYPSVAKDDFSLELIEEDGGLTCLIVYDAQLFQPRFVEGFYAAFEASLQAVLDAPDCLVKALPLLDGPQRRRVLFEWNDTRVEVPSSECIHQLFGRQAAAVTHNVAVVSAHHVLTYGELDHRANQLAHHLRDLGVGPDVLVAVCATRSPQMIIALLGILKAGGAFVPLDPQNPLERNAFILNDSAARVLISEETLAARLPRSEAVPVLMDAHAEAIARRSGTDPHVGVRPDNLAYCIYTSGSTGRPKGVLINHRNIANHVLMHASVCALTPDDRVLQFASVTFDTAMEEIFPTLITGARLVMRPPQLTGPDEAFIELLRRNGITVLDLPTAFWHLWAKERAPVPDSLRLVIVGGEQLHRTRVEDWTAGGAAGKHGGGGANSGDEGIPRLLNTYGPTESTISVLTFDLSREGLPQGEIPVGRPIANIQVYLLDTALNPVPVGVVGEIHIAGVGLARGYLNRAELTAEKFIPNPFGEPGSRMYRSGDLGRYLEDGNIEFFGRNDGQVKLRGFRIELGEIESALLGCPGVRQAAVVAREEAGKEKRLAAYVSLQPGVDVAVAELRAWLRKSLPEYMVPAAWGFMEALPLTSSGKLDRKALPPLIDSHSTVERPPATPMESALAELWAEVLELRADSISVADNFFNLGGHSLAAVQLTYLIDRKLQVKLQVRDILMHATLEDLASLIASRAQDLADYIRYKERAFAESYQVGRPKPVRSGAVFDPQAYLGDLRSHLQEYVTKYNTPGVAVAVHRAGTDYVACAGVESLDSGRDVTPDSQFSPGCVAKLYTATVLMQLVQEGKLALDDPVRAHIPGFHVRDPVASEQVTVRHLLNHTSGIDQSGLDGVHFGGLTGIEQYVAALQGSSVHFTPGTGAYYSDADYIVAARVAELVTGKHWDALMREYVLDPIRAELGHCVGEESCARYISSPQSPGQLVPARHLPVDPLNALNPADGSNVLLDIRALLAFAKLHFPWAGQEANSRRVRPFDRDVMRESRVSYDFHPDFNALGLSWLFYRDSSFGHAGNGVGHQCALRMFPAQETAVVLFANRFPATAVLNEILAHVSEEFATAPAVNDDLLEEMGNFVGTFRCDGGTVRISAAGPRLLMALSDKNGERQALLHRIPRTRYFAVLSDAVGLWGQVTFIGADPSGKYQYLAHKLRWFKRV
ncbi:MAG TPA: amino acid adenylation domain-containing protein [Steroidobacteraceae bacterium]